MNFRKLFFAFGALGMLLSSCNKIAEIENLNESSGLPQVIMATFDATRTSIDNDWNTSWDENDKMTVYVTRESNHGSLYGYSQFTYKGDGKFEGTVNGDFCSPYNWFAVYPSFHSSSSTSSKVEAKIEHPATQTMTGNTKTHIAGANDPIFGYVLGVKDNPSIRMHHIASVIDFNVTNNSDNAIKVTKVEFTAPEKIAGEFTADVELWNGDVQNPDWKAEESAVNTVTLNVNDGVEIAENESGDFYAAIHPISVKGDFTIKVTATSEGKTYVAEKTVNADLTFNAGKYRTINFTFVPGEPEPDQKCYVKVTSAPQDWSGTYIIVDESAKKAFDENASSYASTVTINDGKVLWDETIAKCQVTISPSSISGMYDIKTENGKYMYSFDYSETTLNGEKTQSGNTYYNSLSISNGNVTMYSTRNGSSGASVNYFGYVSNTSDNPNKKNFGYKEKATTRTVQLYKLEGSNPTPPTPSTKTYTKVTSFVSGKKYIVVYDGKALQNNNGVPAAYSVTASGSTITLSSDVASSLEWTASSVSTYSVSGHYSLTNNGKYAARTDDSQNGFEFQTSAVQKAVWDLDNDGNDLYQKNSSGAYTFYLTYSNSKWSVSSMRESNKTAVYAEGEDPVPPTPSTKTYTKVTSAPDNWTEGKYLIINEKSNVAFAFDQSSYKTSVSISNDKIVSNDLEKFEVTFSLSSDGQTDHFDIKTSNGKFLFRGSGDSNFLNDSNTYNGSQYYHKIDAGSTNGDFMLTSKYASAQTTYKFYYSSSSSAFKYSSNSNYVQIYKLDDGSTPDIPDTPTPSGTVFNLENDYLKAYLDAAEAQYTNNTTSSIISSYAGGSDANDLPKPVTLTWSGSATSISIYEGTTTTGSAVKTMNFSSSSSVNIYNLIPGKTYSYKTSNNQTGTFSTTGRRRMIKVSDTQSENNARNCRDLGGIKTRDGKTLKYGLLYRGTNLDRLTEAERIILHDDLGIRLVQDLRNETSKNSSPIGSDVEFCHHGGYDSGTIANQNGDNMKQSVLHVMNAVIEGRPVYFHCRIGSDRTGHMGMLYLALLGCDLKECDIDYEITSFASKMTYGTRKIGSGNEDSFRSKFIRSPYNNNSVPEAVEAYVTGTLGISLDTVKKFRKAMGVSETLN